MSIAYSYGMKLAAPLSALRVGLQHGAVSALGGAITGGAIGSATAGPDATTRERLTRAGKGALLGGTVAGLGGGITSGRFQRQYVGALDKARAEMPGKIQERLNQYQALAGSEAANSLRSTLQNQAEQSFANAPRTWLG